MRILLLAGLLALSGCTSYSLTRVRNDLARDLPEARIGEGYAVAFGRFSLGAARFFAGFADDEDAELARLVLRDVRKVQFGHYDVEGEVDGARVVMPARLRRYVERDGWDHLATFRDDGEAGWVLYREGRDTVTDLLVVVLNEEELVLARLSGDLGRIVENVAASGRIEWPGFREAASEDEADAVEAAVEAVHGMP